MNKIFLSAVSFFIAALFALSAAFPAYGEPLHNGDDVDLIIDGIVSHEIEKCGADTVQEWINGGLSDNAGLGSEWYILALLDGEHDFSAFIRALDRYIESAEGGRLSASSSLKFALVFLASGDTSHDEYIKKTADECIGAQGVMSLIYGLHLLNNGAESTAYSREALVEKLLTLQLPDGGWAVMGEHGDADVTAMAVQSLAPFYDSSEKAKSSLDAAVELLSRLQLDDGGYKSFGKPNPESAAQVIAALSALGTDFRKDERFIKNGCDILSAIKKFRLPDGSFSHELDGGSNETATVQIYYCLCSYKKMLGGDNFFIFEKKSGLSSETTDNMMNTEISEDEKNIENAESSEETIYPDEDEKSVSVQNGGYKIIAYIVIISAAGIICSVLFVIKKRNFKNYVFVLAAAGAAAIIVAFTNFSSAEDYYGASTPKENIIGKVTFSVSCAVLLGEDSEYIPSDGFIIPVEEFSVSDGETVRDILIEAVKKHGVQLECGADSYVRGIGYIYEFDHGDLSGWMYRVNGETPSVNCGSFVLSDGDVVEWLYTRNIGADLEENYD